MSLKLYGAGPSRWIRPYWTLNELGVPFEAVQLNLPTGEATSPEYLAINPDGKVPALVDGDVTLLESAAICNYLADKYPEKGLAPKPGTVERARYDQWISFVISDLEQPLWRIIRHKFLYPAAQRSLADIELAKADFRRMAATLEVQISDHLVGDRFSVADIVMAYTLKWATWDQLLDGYPKLQAYMEHHTARPTFPRQFFAR